MKSNKNFLIVLVTFLVALSLPLGAYEKIKDYLSITTGAVEVRILNGDLDPSVSGVAAPIGSEYLRDNGDSFKKVGSFDVDWIRQLNTSTPVGLELMEDPSFEKSVSSFCVSDNTAPFHISDTSLKSPNNKKATRINLKESGVTNYTCTMPVGASYEGTPIRHKGWLTLWSAGNFSCSIVAQWNGDDVGNAQIITSSQNTFYDLEVIPTGAGTTGFKLSCDNTALNATYFVIHDETSNKAERLSPVLADVKRTQSETLLSVGNLTQTTNLASFAVENDSGVRGIYSKGVDGLTFHQDAQVSTSYFSYKTLATSTVSVVYLDGVIVGGNRADSSSGFAQGFYTGLVKAGQKITFSQSGSGGSPEPVSNIQISATATSPTIVMQNETFNSDLHLGAWVAQPNTATCSSAVIEGEANIGKWTTCSVAINSNTVSGCTTRPTQLDSEARSQGIRIYTRLYNAPSTCAEPALVFVNTGKKFSGETVRIFKDTSRNLSADTRFMFNGTNYAEGLRTLTFNPTKGTVLFDSGNSIPSSLTSKYVYRFDDGTEQNNGYLVISASKNPAISGLDVADMNYISDGVERATSKRLDGKIVYRRTWKVDATATTDVPAWRTIQTGLNPIDSVIYQEESGNVWWMLKSVEGAGSSTAVVRIVYNSTTGNIGLYVASPFQISAGTTFSMEYTKD